MGAIAGAILGGKKEQGKESSNTNIDMRQGLEIEPVGANEAKARQGSFEEIDRLRQELEAVSSSNVQRRFKALIDEVANDPSPERIAAANAFSREIFAGSTEALNQSLEDQRRRAASTAARQGRSSSDPILAAKLAQEQIRQTQGLEAQRRSFAAEESINAPARQVAAAGNALSFLTNQALTNRQALFNMGNTFAEEQRNFRLASATRTNIGTQNTTNTQFGPGGFAGALGGFMGGLSRDVGLFNQMSGSGSPQNTNGTYSPSGGGGGGGGGMGSAAGMLAMFSDINVKENIRSGSNKIENILLNLTSYEYEYKEKHHGMGPQISIMAQDLEKAGLTQAVVNTSEGKYIDYGKAFAF